MISHNFSAASRDARNALRLVFRRPAVLHVDAQHAVTARTLDISMEGICVQADLSLPVNASCTVEFNASYSADPVLLRLQGRVAYCVLAGASGFRIGLHIPHLDAHMKKHVETILTMQKFRR
jgi:hypothetical protein